MNQRYPLASPSGSALPHLLQLRQHVEIGRVDYVQVAVTARIAHKQKLRTIRAEARVDVQQVDLELARQIFVEAGADILAVGGDIGHVGQEADWRLVESALLPEILTVDELDRIPPNNTPVKLYDMLTGCQVYSIIAILQAVPFVMRDT